MKQTILLKSILHNATEITQMAASIRELVDNMKKSELKRSATNLLSEIETHSNGIITDIEDYKEEKCGGKK